MTGILGSATPADPAYGADGVFRVQFPGQPAPDCPGPNYIVQGYRNQSLLYYFPRGANVLMRCLFNRLHGRRGHCAVQQLHNPLHPQP